jgi:hypothetical protein
MLRTYSTTTTLGEGATASVFRVQLASPLPDGSHEAALKVLHAEYEWNQIPLALQGPSIPALASDPALEGMLRRLLAPRPERRESDAGKVLQQACQRLHALNDRDWLQRRGLLELATPAGAEQPMTSGTPSPSGDAPRVPEPPPGPDPAPGGTAAAAQRRQLQLAGALLLLAAGAALTALLIYIF